MKLFVCLLAAQAFSQTLVDLARQSRNADFSTFSSTRPVRLVASLPATCQSGEVVFATTGAPGQKLYLCTAAGAWEAAAGATAATILDFAASKTAPNVVTIGPLCSDLKPCRARFGAASVALTSPATVTLDGSSGTGILFVWLDTTGVRAGRSGDNTITCNSYCGVESGAVMDFPARSLPLAALTYTSNVFDAVTDSMDRRIFLNSQYVEAGPSGNLTVTTNGASGAAEVDLNGELDFGGYLATRVFRRGTLAQRPATCSAGDLYFQTDGPAGIHDCIAANQWHGPLASQAGLATVDNRTTLTAQTGDSSAATVLAAGHPAGTYRICAAASVTTAAASGSMDIVLTWRSPASATDLAATLLSVSAAGVGEEQGCRVINSTGAAAVTLDPSDAGSAEYQLAFSAERLQ